MEVKGPGWNWAKRSHPRAWNRNGADLPKDLEKPRRSPNLYLKK